MARPMPRLAPVTIPVMRLPPEPGRSPGRWRMPLAPHNGSTTQSFLEELPEGRWETDERLPGEQRDYGYYHPRHNRPYSPLPFHTPPIPAKLFLALVCVPHMLVLRYLI